MSEKLKPNWKPIETCPKDGEVFMAFVPYEDPLIGFQFVALINGKGRLLSMMTMEDMTDVVTHWHEVIPLPQNTRAGVATNGR